MYFILLVDLHDEKSFSRTVIRGVTNSIYMWTNFKVVFSDIYSAAVAVVLIPVSLVLSVAVAVYFRFLNRDKYVDPLPAAAL